MRNRGALIVLEGCDRAGKTTQCKKLGENFFRGYVFMNFIIFIFFEIF